MQILVTGGAGFIGAHLVEALVAEGAGVRVVDDLSSGDASHVQPEADLVVGDLADPGLMAEAVKGADAVVHLGAHRSVVRSIDSPLDTDRVNTHGTLIVLESARLAGVPRVVYASSSSVYGGAAQLPTPETEPLIPRSPYAVSKLAGEHYGRVYHELFGITTVGLRYFNVYGPRQSPDSVYAPVIPLWIKAAQESRPAEVHGDGMQSRDFTYVGDAVRATLLAMRAEPARCGGKAYNVAGGSAHTLMDVLETISRLMDRTVEKVHAGPRAGDVRHTQADVSAAAADLGYVSEVGLDEGLRRTVDYMQQHG